MKHTCYPPLDESDLEHAFTTLGEDGWRGLAGKRIFLTGGTGFVGKWLLATLSEAERRLGLGCQTTVLSRDPEAFSASAPQLAQAPGVELVGGDVRDFAFPNHHFDMVIHAATDVATLSTPRATFDTCVRGTQRVLELAQSTGATNFLLVSSGAVYGRQPPLIERITESYSGAPDILSPAAAYGEGKRASEWLACAQAAETGLRVSVARCFAFVGPYLPLDRQFAIGNFLRSAMAGEEIIIRGDGTAHRSYLHAADMAAWLWAVLMRGRPGVAYNVGGEQSLSIADLAHRIVRLLESTSTVHTLQTPPCGQLAERYVPDTTLAQTELRLGPPIALDDAIIRTARWHRAHCEVA